MAGSFERSADQLRLLPPNFGIRGSLRLPEDLLPDGEVALLLQSEVGGDQRGVGAAEVGEGARQVHANVDLPVGLGDLVGDFHSGIADVVCYRCSFDLRERVSMGDSRLALQVLLILLLVLAGTSGGALAAPLEWIASSDPTRVVFQAIETRGESTRSATLYGNGRVEVWQETPRSPAFQQEILRLDEAKHHELVTSAIRSGLPEWGDDASLARLQRSRLDAAREASGEEERRVLLILQSSVDGSPYEVIRTLEDPARQAISADLAEQLPEIGWASRWATVLLAAKQLPHDDNRAELRYGRRDMSLAGFERADSFTLELVDRKESKTVAHRTMCFFEIFYSTRLLV